MKNRLVAILVGSMIIIIFGMTFESVQYSAKELMYRQSTTTTQTSNQCWI